MGNNLKGSRFYLSGPMDYCSERGAVWRDWISPILKDQYHAKILNPLDKKIKGYSHLSEDKEFAEKRRRLIEEEKYDEVADIMKDVRHIDLRLVDRADALIVYLDYTKIMTGTLEEVFMANSQKKPLVIMCEQGKNKIPPWLLGTVPHSTIFSSWDSVLEYLNYVDGSEADIVCSDGRWLFFEED